MFNTCVIVHCPVTKETWRIWGWVPRSVGMGSDWFFAASRFTKTRIFFFSQDQWVRGCFLKQATVQFHNTGSRWQLEAGTQRVQDSHRKPWFSYLPTIQHSHAQPPLHNFLEGVRRVRNMSCAWMRLAFFFLPFEADQQNILDLHSSWTCRLLPMFDMEVS